MSQKRHISSYEDLAESLVEETLQEAADTFFGQRKSIEQELELYSRKVQELKSILLRVQTRQANLHFVLAEGHSRAVEDFYRQLQIDPKQVPEPEGVSPDLRLLEPAFALRTKSRYAKLLLRTYTFFASQAEEYMHGRSYKDPEDPRRQRITVNYDQVYAFYKQLAEKIRKTNQESSPTEVLQFAKKLDIERSAKESLVGTPLNYSLDEEMAIPQPDFAQSGLAAYPDFPDPEKAKKIVVDFAHHMLRRYPEQVRTVLDRVKKHEGANEDS
ncbi:hypothetical protein [Desulfovermiculus halophilus]|jgi:hypothetical protein|uniref:hypothetical protein n=1 Tax=Desulfovermiculus halophilus TaxID=339722 RepID=UPI0004832454|nr:hypothetical protein [Desulfovermiculus halophilus]